MSEPDEVPPRIVPRSQHPISRKAISRNAVKVLYRLHNAGYRSYLVGGSVRDLMLGRRPKDFDIGTDARPNDVRRLFSNSRIIGRRFRLVHVYFHDGDIVEVSTFRRDPEPEEQRGEPGDLLITSDNTYGTPREDAFRRDFTINALFYDVAEFSVIDYVGGIEDLERKLVRAIGDPDLRFREDPVRMLRACEFAARLGFGIELHTQEAIHRHRQDLERASPARVTEEIAQLLRCGHAGAAMQWMLELGLLEVLLPEAYAMVSASARGQGDFGQMLPVIDAMVAEGREFSDTVLLAALLLPKVLLRRDDIEGLNQRPMSRAALESMIEEEVRPFLARFTLSNLKSQQVLHALMGFQRLCEPRWTPVERVRFARKPYFADALTLFELLVAATREGGPALAEWQSAARRAQGIERAGVRQAAKAAQETVAGTEAVRARPRRRRRRR